MCVPCDDNDEYWIMTIVMSYHTVCVPCHTKETLSKEWEASGDDVLTHKDEGNNCLFAFF